MMKIANMQMAIRQIGAILLATALASSSISCAPSQQPSNAAAANANANQKQSSSPSPSAGSQGPAAISATASGAAPASGQPINNGQRQLSSVAAEFNAMPSLVSMRDGQASAPSDQSSAQLDAFDGKNPFTDDSLWQIPIHFERESAAAVSSSADSLNDPAASDNMAKSASELTASADEHDDEMGDGDSVGIGSILDHQQQQPSAPTAPALISASTTASDLKTAAGYNHATPHHYGDAGHYAGESHHHNGAGHYGAGHHGDHYGGKYFQ